MGIRHRLSRLCPAGSRSSIRGNTRANQTWWSLGKSTASPADFFPAKTFFRQTPHLKFSWSRPNRDDGFICKSETLAIPIPPSGPSSVAALVGRYAIYLRVDNKDYLFVWPGRSVDPQFIVARAKLRLDRRILCGKTSRSRQGLRLRNHGKPGQETSNFGWILATLSRFGFGLHLSLTEGFRSLCAPLLFENSNETHTQGPANRVDSPKAHCLRHFGDAPTCRAL
jgi:hypothetical protein